MPPPLPRGALFVETETRRSERYPTLRMPPPSESLPFRLRSGPTALPLVMVMSEMSDGVAKLPVTKNTRLALLPLTVSLLTPSPLIVSCLSTTNCPPLSAMVWPLSVEAKSTVPLAGVFAMAQRRLPKMSGVAGGLSLLLVTVRAEAVPERAIPTSAAIVASSLGARGCSCVFIAVRSFRFVLVSL